LRRVKIFISLVVLFVAIDFFSKQIIKHNLPIFAHISIIDNFLNIVYVKNKGIAFGFLKNLPVKIKDILLIYLPLGITIILSLLVIFSKKISRFNFLGFTLIISGAIGNLIDRFFYGYVVDFIDFHYKKFHWPAFNFADSFITIGVILLIIDEFIKKVKRK